MIRLPIDTVIVLAVAGLVVTACTTDDAPAAAPSEECFEETSLEPTRDTTFPNPATAVDESDLLVDLTDDERAALREQAVEGADSDGVVVVGVDGIVVGIEPTDGGWYVSSVTIPTDC